MLLVGVLPLDASAGAVLFVLLVGEGLTLLLDSLLAGAELLTSCELVLAGVALLEG